MTYKAKQGKALWTQLPGARVSSVLRKRVRFIRPMSKIRNRQIRTYAFQARLWKEGRLCEAQGLKHNGKVICSNRPHLCTQVHHRRGKVASLLLDTNYWSGLCDRSHRFMHDNPAAAKDKGFIEGPWNHQPAIPDEN